MSMDRIIEDKHWIKRKYWKYIIAAVFILSVLTFLLLQDHESTLRVEKDKLSISTVTEGPFQDYINMIGQVEPISNVTLEALESGSVQEIILEQGAIVKAGDVILTLANDDLNMGFLDEESSYNYLTNDLKNNLLGINQDELDTKQYLLELETDLNEKQRLYEKTESLYQKGGVSDEEYLSTKSDYEIALANQKLEIEQAKIDSIIREDDKKHIEIQMQQIRQRLENLKVKATVDGQLSLEDIEVGESLAKGRKIGQISILSSYKITAQIDQFYIDRISVGLQASLVRQEDTFHLTVVKVNPEVVNSVFDVDLRFTGDMPQNIRLGQTYNIDLQLGETQDALLLARGGFFQSTGGQWVYVLDENGESASKRQIRIGRYNPQYYEITDGLSNSEKVITSSYDLLGDNEKLIFK